MARALKNVMRLIDEVNNQQSPEQSFLNDLKRSIELSEQKNTRKPSNTYKPSSMNCIRNMYYQVTGTNPDQPTVSYVLTGIVNSGTDIHLRVQKAVANMKENGIDCDYIDVAEFVKSRGLDYLDVKDSSGMETKLYHKDLNMSFLCDGIIRYKGHYYILELKTESIYKWQARQGVDPVHYNQATAYSVALGLDEVIFVYINRDLLDMKSFMFHVTDDMKHDLVGRIEECDACVLQHRVPTKPANLDRKTCEYCIYKKACRRDGGEN